MPKLIIEVQSRVVGANKQDLKLDPVLLELLNEQITVAELIQRTVEEQVRDLIHKRKLEREAIEATLEHQYAINNQPLTEAQLQALAEEGAIRYLSEAKLSAKGEVKKALHAFKEGKYAIFIDGNRVANLAEEITFKPETKVVFVRVMPLKGG